MVAINPLWMIVVLMAAAFLLGLRRRDSGFTEVLAILAAPGFAVLVSAAWMWRFIQIPGESGASVFTAGFTPPVSIMLHMGPEEAFAALLINLLGLLGGLFLLKPLLERGRAALAAFLMLLAALNGLVMTGDLFNLFVFMEIAAIAVAGLVVLGRDPESLTSGFKYLIAGGLVTGTLLMGTIFVYHLGGGLSLTQLAEARISALPGGVTALFLVVVSLVLELKPFPANGWALDLYTAVHPGMSALISGAYSTAVLAALTRVLPLWGGEAYRLVLVLGLITFIGSNLAALVQQRDRRLLGYSSVAQLGLLMTVVGLRPRLGGDFLLIAGGLLVSHALAKALLFWLSDLVKNRSLADWRGFARRPFLLMAMGTAVLMLTGFPPFPSFFAKWRLIMRLAGDGAMAVVWLVLLGSLLEMVYLFRWLGMAAKEDPGRESSAVETPGWRRAVPLTLVTLTALATGVGMAWIFPMPDMTAFLVLGFAGLLFMLDFLPAWMKNTLVITATGGLAYYILPGLDGIRQIFGAIFLVGGVITLLAGYAWKGARRGFYPLVVLMFGGMAMLLTAVSMLEFYFGWEIMTAGSYFLILRGRRSLHHAFHYMLFSAGGALAMLAGFGLAGAAAGGDSGLTALPAALGAPGGTLVFILLTLGFLSKTATLPLHIWLPGAHAEAETDVSPMVSAILLKAGAFGMVLLLMAWKTVPGGGGAALFLSWLGAGTALLGSIMAALQEDAKRLLAYSSISQLGYVLFGLAFMNHLGWLSAMAFSINHVLFKGLLFLAIGGVVWRVKTRNMYQMGGLITNMPLTFLTVLIGIIALSGVPPLSGFAGKWIVFNAIVLKGWELQGAVVLMAGMVAFLYCFRLIHAIFLGVPKDRHRNVREAPFWILLPQFLLVGGIMVFSMAPNVVLGPVGRALTAVFPRGGLEWRGSLAISSLGYWDGTRIMYITGAVFVGVLLWLTLFLRRSQKVKAFNIVYAAERPFRPETTHFAHNFFAPLRSALGFLVTPLAVRFWRGVADTAMAVSDFCRRLYNGNAQVYVLHMVLYVLVVFFFWTGVSL